MALKILFLHALSDAAVGGGAEVVVWSQMCGLRDAGYKCILLTTRYEPGLQCHEQDGITVWQGGIRNLYWPYDNQHKSVLKRMAWHAIDSYNPFMQGYLRKVIALEKPDVISMHNLAGWSSASWKTAAELNVPAVQILHDYYPICAKSTLYKQSRNCARQCVSCRLVRLPHRSLSNQLSAVVGVSQYTLDRHLAEGYFHKVFNRTVIHNVRDPTSLRVDSVSHSLEYLGIRFGYIGQLIPSKGIELIIDAIMELHHVDAELWIAGSGKSDYETTLRERAQSDRRIRFMGRVLPKDFYPNVDVIVVPSLWNEAFGLVIVEALAFGKPLIASHHGGIPEIIRDGDNGLLFNPMDTSSLVTKLKRVAYEPELLARLTARAIPSAQPFMNIKSWVGAYTELYQKIARENKRTRMGRA